MSETTLLRRLSCRHIHMVFPWLLKREANHEVCSRNSAAILLQPDFQKGVKRSSDCLSGLRTCPATRGSHCQRFAPHLIHCHPAITRPHRMQGFGFSGCPDEPRQCVAREGAAREAPDRTCMRAQRRPSVRRGAGILETLTLNPMPCKQLTLNAQEVEQQPGGGRAAAARVRGAAGVRAGGGRALGGGRQLRRAHARQPPRPGRARHWPGARSAPLARNVLVLQPNGLARRWCRNSTCSQRDVQPAWHLRSLWKAHMLS